MSDRPTAQELAEAELLDAQVLAADVELARQLLVGRGILLRQEVRAQGLEQRAPAAALVVGAYLRAHFDDAL